MTMRELCLLLDNMATMLIRSDCRPPSKIHDLALSGRAQDLATYLREEGTGVDVNAKDSYGFAPIHLATDRGVLLIPSELSFELRN